MIKQIYNIQDLPVGDLERIGLAKNGIVMLDHDDLTALLSGRRTDMLRLENLKTDGLQIPALDAKLSLKPDAEGKLQLLLHPIYREPEVPAFLTDTQAEMLEKGEVPNLQQMIFDGEGNPREVLIEFDKDTNEFVVTDTERIQAPDEINDIPLTAEQKKRYMKGEEVETQDGTTIQYSGTEKQGIRSDKLALIASILIDGGISYLLYKGLHALYGKKQDQEHGANYQQALKNRQKDEIKQQSTVLEPGEDFDEEASQSMGR